MSKNGKKTPAPATVTLTLKPMHGHKTRKGHVIGWIAVLPEGVVGVCQQGATAREVAFITAWAAPVEPDPEIKKAFARLR